MKRYTIQIMRASYKPEYRCKPILGLGDYTPQWQHTTLANDRLSAILNVLPLLQSELPKLTGVYVSVFVGRNNPDEYPTRLIPFQVIVETGSLRITDSGMNRR